MRSGSGAGAHALAAELRGAGIEGGASAYGELSAGEATAAASAADTASLTRGVATAGEGGAISSPTLSGVAPSSAAAGVAASQFLPRGAEDLVLDLPLSAEPDSPEFGEEVATRLRVFIRDGVKEARLHLQPAELGRVLVTINTEGDQARVSFLAESGIARDAIEQALPRLRDMLEQQGLQLADADVGQQQFSGQTSADAGANPTAQSSDDSGESDEAFLAETRPPESDSRIDTYI